MNQKLLKEPIAFRPVLPPDDGPYQMSPFSDDRWEIDQQEIMKRRELHKNLIFSNLKQSQRVQPVEEIIYKVEEPGAPAESFPVNNPKELEPVPELKTDLIEKEAFKFEPPTNQRPKALNEIQFETPRPPNLFPLLKFPEKKFGSEVLRRPTSNYITPILGKVPEMQEGNPKKPPFAEFKDIKIDSALIHYGASIPFWQFK